MTSQSATAVMACRDLEASTIWYADLFDRAPDLRHGESHAEWRHGLAEGLALVRDVTRAGTGALILRVRGIGTRSERIEPLAIGASGDHRYLARLRDPDGNIVTLTL
ncbi:VOC family protein [Oceanicola sp. 22II-s10i]|uniref:VOC family protein n=1 Tax=Oceanicola sp. 22II-s10i TaxID=1317116 RepID=UPI000B5203AB|nr:glyoxalase/bleomycin resistance/dioxygenase family protein [Oceanicola sp. 22II-s10i]